LRTYRHLAAKLGTSKGGGKAVANYSQELAQDAVSRDWALVPSSPDSKAEY